MKITTLVIGAFALTAIADLLDRASTAGLAFGNVTGALVVARYLAISLLVLVIVRTAAWKQIPKTSRGFVFAWWAWCAVSVVHGFITAADYWDWRFLLGENLLRLNSQVWIVAGLLLPVHKGLVRFVILVVFPASFALLVLPIEGSGYLYSSFVAPVAAILLLAPYLKRRHAALVCAVGLVSALVALDYRANVLKIAGAAAVLCVYASRKFIPIRAIQHIALMILLTPALILALAAQGAFNPFAELNAGQDVVIQHADGSTENLKADTRTFLYREALGTLTERNSWFFGEGAAGSYDSVFGFEYLVDSRRYATEVGFLNVLLHLGIVGFVLYFFVVAAAMYLAICRSRNYLSKMIGLVLAFRWLIFFVEDPAVFNSNIAFLWILIGLGLSPTLRSMEEGEIHKFFAKLGRGPV